MQKIFLLKKLYNSFAFRVNRLGSFFQLKFTVRLNGKTFIVPVINTLGEINVYTKEDWFFHFVKSLDLPSDVDIVDVGLNVGQSLLAIKSCYENNYWGFEPNPTCVFYLEQLIKVNKLKNTTIIPVGLFSTNKLAKLYANHAHDTAATLHSELKPGLFNPQKAIYVPVFSFEELQLNGNKIGFVKIDVEGAELEVVEGMLKAIRQHRPVIVCEVLDYTSLESQKSEQERATNLVNRLKEENFRLFRIEHSNDRKLSFTELETITLKKWVPESLYQNDYLFLPEPVAQLAWLNGATA